MEVRKATPDDLWEVASIHKARFCSADYALGRYSVGLIRCFYRAFLGQCIFLVHVSDHKVDGFVLGGDPGQLWKAERTFIWKHVLRCCLETSIRPGLWPVAFNVLRSLFLPRGKEAASELPQLLSLAVDKSAEGRGTAAALVEAFEDSLRSRYSAYELSVVKTNRQAVRFYEKLGLKIMASDRPRYFVFKREFQLPREEDRQES